MASILKRGFIGSMFALMRRPFWPEHFAMIKSIIYNFFYLQYRARLFPKKAKISWVDHPLDDKIPFTPSWINIYMDFSPFWIRTQAFLAKTFGKAADPYINSFVRGIGELYSFAGLIYKRNLSTTRRPLYLGKPGFVSIHLFDPHLMCIPSLHVMVVIMTYRKIKYVLACLGVEKEYAGQIEDVRRHALDITESILFVKQHSINCIAAALYAMTCYDEQLFPVSEAMDFTNALFIKCESIPAETRAAIKKHIFDLYLSFLDARSGGGGWERPLLDFLSAAGTKSQVQADSCT
ncbi:MAG: hypothetical protein LBC27_04500 [Spirochaetaceae bacterium]|jgi:hypothetical protein|nr:hypothetical protein [Spirochaetaceae bacterium]